MAILAVCHYKKYFRNFGGSLRNARVVYFDQLDEIHNRQGFHLGSLESWLGRTGIDRRVFYNHFRPALQTAKNLAVLKDKQLPMGVLTWISPALGIAKHFSWQT
jgi:hypothetical protein